jgi:hypothetical protein
MTRWLFLVVIAVNSAACTIYWGDDDCDYEAYPTEPQSGYVDPYTNQCQYAYYPPTCGGGYEDRPLAQPAGATCPGPCDYLTEAQCHDAAECRITYTGDACDPSTGSCLEQEFNHCWGIYGEPPTPGDCRSLDAYGCASRNDCSAVYSYGYYAADAESGAPAPVMTFLACQPEWETPTTGCEAITCEPGTHCVEECYPCDDADGDGICPPYCDAYCVPDATCDGVTCPLDTHCELECTIVEPSGDTSCSPVCMPDNGCEVVDCPPGSHCEETCVVIDCLPDTECPPPTCTVDCVPDGPSCETIADEATCVARPDCTSVYEGFNCTCDSSGNNCTCETLIWDRCETQ